MLNWIQTTKFSNDFELKLMLFGIVGAAIGKNGMERREEKRKRKIESQSHSVHLFEEQNEMRIIMQSLQINNSYHIVYVVNE